MANLADGRAVAGDGSALAAYFSARHDASFSWKDLAWLRASSRCRSCSRASCAATPGARSSPGVDGVMVSNHGGRQLDGAPATLDALPGVVDAVAGRCEVLLDGGIRRGTDVVKALALGARAVLLGRPILWGLAVGGEAGATRVLEIVRDELSLAMALAGCPTLSAIDRDLVRRRI